MSQWMQCNFIQTSPTWADATCNIKPSGGYTHPGPVGRIPVGRKREPDELRRQREELGIIAREVIENVAAQQVARLEQDGQKQFDELSRELLLRNIEWQAGYLTALAAERERLINAEIASRLTAKLRAREQSEVVLLTLLAAAAVL